jgi:putative ABC transport system permease protein
VTVWKATVKGLLARKVRLALTAISIVVGVAFVSGTFILTDTIGRAFDNLFSNIEKGVAVQVTGIPRFQSSGINSEEAGSAQRVPASLLPTIRAVPGVRNAIGTLTGYAQLVDKKGKAITTGGAPTLGVSWADDPQLNPLHLTAGRAPRSDGEIVVDRHTASGHDLRVGDHVTVLLQGPSMQATIVGIAKFGTADNLAGATLVAFDPVTAQTALKGGGKFDTIDVAANAGVTDDQLKAQIQSVLPAGFQAKTGAETAAKNSRDLKKALSFFNIALLVFAVIALFVGAFIIFNTFQILVSQRTRELGLLRALGASPAQIRRSVIAEAVIVGLIASVVGLAAGFALALGLRALLNAFGVTLPSTTLQLEPRTIIAAFVVGLGATMLSSVVPALRASRIPPIAAMREAQPTTYAGSTRRRVTGLVITAAGIGILLTGLFGGGSNAASFAGLGAATVFFGVAVLSPLIVRPVARVLGAPLRRRGISGKLGQENAMRNPKRTASTAAALMIGLGLVAFVGIFAQSIKASSDQILQQTMKADYIVTNPQFTGFSQDVADKLRQESAFSAVSQFRQGLFGLKGGSAQVQGIDPSTVNQVVNVDMASGSLSALGTDDVAVFDDTAKANGWKVGDVVPARFARTGLVPLRIVGIFTDKRILGSYVVSLPTYEQNFVEQLDILVLVKTAPGTSQADARAAAKDVAKAFPNVKVEDQAQFRESQAAQINALLGLITALLGLAILIAVIGIVNTLALSIYERTREIGLLRAVGMGRRQVRAMIRWESVIIAVFGALLGTAIGIFFGWAMVRALKSQGISVLSIPGGQLIIYILVAALIGVVAALKPARRAAKLDVLSAISYE